MKSKETKITPLSKIHSAVVLLDWNGKDGAETASRAMKFFKDRGISIAIMAPDKKSFNLFGHLTRKARHPEGRKVKRHEDLFISLATGSSRAEEYELKHSPAVFRIGRSVFKKELYDILVTDGTTPESQLKVFDTIIDSLSKIK